jgi:hypothetical protein
MPKMIALKRFHYPSGHHGKDYQPGDAVEVLTDRDAKALRLLRVAKDDFNEPPSPEPPRARLQPKEEERAVPRRGRYARSDMTAEETTEVKPMTTKTGPNPEG